MKFKRKKILLLATVFASSISLHAESPKLQDLTEMQNFYYQKGYNDASEKFYKHGYEQAVFDLVKQMEKYRHIIDAYEAGKYYMQTNRITYPKIYRIKNGNGQYTIHIETPEVKEKLSLEDIFILPEIMSNSVSSQQNYNYQNRPFEIHSGSVGRSNSSTDMNTIYPSNMNIVTSNTSPISTMREFGVSFPKTSRVKQVFDNAGIKYVETPNEYKGYFKNEKDFNTFCKNTSGDSKCSNLYQK